METSNQPTRRKFIKVTMKFIDPSNDERPAKCNESIKKSTLSPG